MDSIALALFGLREIIIPTYITQWSWLQSINSLQKCPSRADVQLEVSQQRLPEELSHSLQGKTPKELMSFTLYLTVSSQLVVEPTTTQQWHFKISAQDMLFITTVNPNTASLLPPYARLSKAKAIATCGWWKHSTGNWNMLNTGQEHEVRYFLYPEVVFHDILDFLIFILLLWSSGPDWGEAPRQHGTG